MSSRVTLFSCTSDVDGLPQKAVAMQKSQSRAIQTGHRVEFQDGIEDNGSHRTAVRARSGIYRVVLFAGTLGHMQCDLLTTAVWWRDSGVKLPARVQTVQSAPGLIKQRNCSVLPYVLG